MAIKTHKVTLSLDNPRVIQSGINVQSFDKQSIQISIELTKNDEVFQVPSDATIRISLLKLARQEQKIIVDVPNTNRDSIDWVVPDYLDGYQGTVRVGVYLVSGAENVDLGYFTILSNVSDIDKMADEFTDNVFQGWEQIEADLNELNHTIAQTKLDLADDLTQIDNTIANINTLASDFTADVATKQSDVTSKYNAFDTSVTTANQTIDDILALQPKFQSVLDETTGKDVISAPEIILARNGEADLKARLDKEHQQVTAQLAQTVTETDTKLSGKRNKSDKINSSDLAIDSDNNKIKLLNLSEEVQSAIAGTAPVISTVADGSLTTAKYANGSITSEKLGNSFNLRGSISENTDLKTIVNQGVYFGQPNGNYLNAPANLATNRYFELKVDVLSPNWAIQKLVDFTTPSNVWHKTIHRTNFSVNNEWNFVGTPANASVNRVKLSDNFSSSGTLASGTNLDKIVKEGVYLGLSTNDYINAPADVNGQSFVLKAQVGGAVNSFITQELVILGDSSKFYKRLNTNADNPGTWSEFKVSNSGGSGGGLAGKTIVQFGDSIYGNKRPPKDISTALANKTGATVHNLGMGGSRMSQHLQFWDATSMYRLADAVATGDYTLQDELIAEYDAGRLNGLPYYVKSVIQLMKTIEWDNVDIITIAHGTNDLTADTLLDSEINEFDTTTYAGALRYSLKAILEVYPHIKVFVISPMYRFWTQDNAPYDFIEDSDEAVFSGGKLPDFVKKAEEVSAEFKVHYIDAYNHFGIGKSNRHYYFDDLLGHGGTHHNDSGAKYIGEKLGSEIVSRV